MRFFPNKNILFHLFLALMSFQGLWCQNPKNHPNVLFIICDDLNDYEGVFGGHPQAKTPNIDALAASGIRFINAESNVPVCCPSRNSMITGVYPHASKDFGWTDLKKQPVLKNNKTLIRYFKENGYKTLGTGKITHGNIREDWDEWGLPLNHNYGPVYFDGEKRTSNPSVPEPYHSIGPIDGSFGPLLAAITSGKKGDKGWVYGPDNKPMRYINDDDRDLMQDELHVQWVKKKIKALENQPDDQPFFLGIGFVRPHTPLHAPKKYFDKFPLDSIKLEKWMVNDEKDTYYKENFDPNDKNNNKGPRYFKTLLASYGGNREVAIKHFLQAYLACVAFVDDQIGEVVKALNASKFKDNTIIILTSDHGWQMGEKQYLFKNSPWEESTRIPMIIKLPNQENGLKIAHPVSLIDLYPTLKDYCHLIGDNKKNNLGGDLGGHSMRPLIEGTHAWQGPNGALSMVGNYGIAIPVSKQNFSYRTKDWRYIRYGNGKEELYDHRSDPYEWTNLAYKTTYQNIKKQLSMEMDQIISNPK